MLHTYIYPFAFFFSLQKRLANLSFLFHPETDFFFGRISKWLKGADCKSVRVFLSGVRIPLLPPGRRMCRWRVASGGFLLFRGSAVPSRFLFFPFSRCFFVLSCTDVLWEFVHKKNTRGQRVFFWMKVLRIIEHLALLFHATLINDHVSFLTFAKLL